MAITAKEHREKRKALVEKAQAFNTEHEDERGLLSSENEATFQSMMDDAAAHLSAATRIESLETASASLETSASEVEAPARIVGQDLNLSCGESDPQTVLVRNGTSSGKPRYVEMPCGVRGSDGYKTAFADYMKHGINGLDSDRLAALQSDDSEQAGYLVTSEQFAAGILKEVDDLLFVRQHAKVHTQLTAKSLGIRKRTGKHSSFNWGSELSTPVADTAQKYGKKVLEPHYGTGSILVSNDLMRNTAGLIESEIRSEMARDAGEGMEDAYLTGDGNEKPLGVFTASSDGVSTSRDVVTGSATNFTLDGLQAAKFALKSQYRNGTRGSARWLIHRTGIEKIAKLKDSNGQPLFRVGAGRQQDGMPPEDMILGFAVDESERSPSTFTNGNYVAVLCNWAYYEIADSLDMNIQRLVELNARSNQTEFLYRIKTDGMPTLEEAFVRLKCGT